jgi:putative PIN family toxin of toxin-antitoxin system
MLRDPRRRDPGVFISALIGPAGSPPDQMVDAWIDDRIEVVVSAQLLAELRRVALRPKFRRWFDEARARELIARIERQATVSPDPPPTPGVTRDPATTTSSRSRRRSAWT